MTPKQKQARDDVLDLMDEMEDELRCTDEGAIFEAAVAAFFEGRRPKKRTRLDAPLRTCSNSGHARTEQKPSQ